MRHPQERGPVQVTLERGMLRLRRGNPQAEGLYDLDTTNALRAFFQAERDAELGRWRDPENPNIVVYPIPAMNDQGDGYGRAVWVLDEAEMVSRTVLDDRHSHSSASHYFAAHADVEPRKPWHDAKAGEYWLVTLEGADPTPTTVGNYCENLYFVVGDDDYYCPTNDHRIQNAVRLTPEETTNE